jgi:hypothetical protein
MSMPPKSGTPKALSKGSWIVAENGHKQRTAVSYAMVASIFMPDLSRKSEIELENSCSKSFDH